ncbi:chemotaxis protein CheW [Pseudoalteromonas luteoviolacea]|uniref:Chemotaxis protein CheW n=1 Tax=Pseudoalteromonas luteoviolacea TaxID=43657 RepID=A0A1C0TVF9_9GAMM|nr:chemotaxis protein CheW [Pseudoalteromonas luteoviolacea]OCQ23307.1 chemotaxis protein CheW [Pseudoalteromonas luteoviolacea]
MSETQPDSGHIHQKDELRYLFVKVGHDHFGIPIDSVKEVIELVETTMVPMCSDVIRGVINVRGSVIPVLDLQRRLGLKLTTPYNKYSCIVLYDFYDHSLEESMTLGMLVNSVVSIEFIDLSKLESSPSFGSNIPRHFEWKMAKINNKLTTLLDIAKVLNVNEINSSLKHEQEQFFIDYCQR